MTTIIFPGQGSQIIGMSKDFYDNFDIAKKTFDYIQDLTKINIKDIIFKNSENLLDITQFTQLSIFCASISIFNVLKEEFDLDKLKINCMLGHSLGEYSALNASGYLSLEDCSNLLKIRGELMQNAYKSNESGMVAIIGLDCKLVEKIINENSLEIEIANDNSPMQVVISGKIKDLENAEIIFKKVNVKRYVFLNVSAAFHSKLMTDAEKKMKDHISNTNFLNSNIAIISNYTGNISNDKKIILNNLSLQMSNRVRWVESVKTLESIKEDKVIEIGPGKILSGLIKRISNKFNFINLEKITDMEKIKNAF
tara:strand:+ start:1748 stop:2677 length:930 start_codon:yes stop_codon:yes gene_type:complete